MNNFNIIKETKKFECKGRVYRCHETMYPTSRGWGHSINMGFLKKKSCQGCEKCGYLEDYLQEFSCEKEVDIRPMIKEKALYQLKIVDIGTDWETGRVDEFGVAFVLIEEEHDK